MEPSGIVTLTSDFGLVDGYVAAMKGVLLCQVVQAQLVDISHQVPRYDIVAGGFVLATAAPYFPRGTVHLAVVDPGVGSSRAAVALRTASAWFVGPDNGLLWRAAGGDGGEIEQAVSIHQAPGAPGARSATFHGRDLFAPAAAYLARGGRMTDLGPEVAEVMPWRLPGVEPGPGFVAGEVIHVDGFGNAQTNITGDDLPPPGTEVSVAAAGEVVCEKISNCYADVSRGASCALLGSEGYLEVAVSEGSAADRHGLTRGSQVRCTWSAAR
jgi:S-adenosylmethionine hydrolase